MKKKPFVKQFLIEYVVVVVAAAAAAVVVVKSTFKMISDCVET